MAELLDAVVSWWSLIWVVLVFGFAPGFCLRLIVLAYPRNDPRRAELKAELYAVPYSERPLWVAAQLECALFEGLGHRVPAAIRGLISRHRERTQTDNVLGRAFWPWLLMLLGGSVLLAIMLSYADWSAAAWTGGTAMMAIAFPRLSWPKTVPRLSWPKRSKRVLARVAVALLADPTGRRCGYELSKQAWVRSGVLYPMLTRMIKEGWVTDGWEDPTTIRDQRLPRRYYQLTHQGQLALRAVLRQPKVA